MKKFLLLCVLFVACLAPGAEAANRTVSISAATADLKAAIDTALDTLRTGGQTIAADDTIEITFTSSVTATIATNTTIIGGETTTTTAIPVPYVYKYDDGGTAVTVNIPTVTVTGPGTIQAGGAWRLFNIEANGTATFSNVTLAGNNTDGSGGVTTAGTTTFDGVTFSNNRAANGGALEITAGTTTLNGTNTFTGNQATTNGGAMALTSGTLTVGTGSTLNFTTNSAANGGAIYTAAALNLSNATVMFKGNTATDKGGAICSENGLVTLAGGTFGGTADGEPNTAVNGGAIHSTGGVTLGANAVTFTRNGATTGTGGSGGAIYSTGAVTLGTGEHQFNNNTAKQSGGAIYTTTTGTLTVNGQTFSTNTAMTGNGGAIASTGAVTLTNGTFTGNVATTGSGGAVYATASNVTVANGTFNNNTAGTNGGVICTTGTVQVDDGSFGETTKNTAARGGAIDAGTGAVIIKGGTFKNNEATGTTGGGAVYAATATLTGNPTFESNKATSGSGGALYAGDSITIGGGAFSSNTATTAVAATPANGGAIYSGGSVSITAGTFASNTVSVTGPGTTANGGAIYANGDVSSISGGTFSRNTAVTSGGAVYANGRVSAISGGTFSNNTAANGGAVYSNGTGEVKISGGTFGGNTANTNGGAVYAKGKVTVTNANSTTFTTVNTATAGSGGAIYAENAAIETTGTEFSNQTAFISGGALYADGNVTVNSGVFSGNTTTDTDATGASSGVGGGAVFSGGNVKVSAGTFSGNISANDGSTNAGGGVIYAVGDVVLEGGTFTGNTSSSTIDLKGNGGGAIWSGGTVTVRGGSFASTSDTPNTAAGSGGGIYAVRAINVAPTTGTITFSYQKSAQGGALYAAGILDGSNTVTSGTGVISAKNTIFRYNEADNADNGHGGATYSAGESTFTNCFFYMNQATRDGGASLANPITIKPKDDEGGCTYCGNKTLRGYGGAIAVKDKTSTIVRSVFDENTADRSGGAIYAGGADVSLTVEETEFMNNVSSGTVAGTTGGGAIATASTPQSLTLWRCTFDSNSANGVGSGGGAYIDAKTFKIANCTFYNNSTNGNGGALLLVGTTGRNSAIIFNTIIKNSSGSSGFGGGISSTANFVFGANIVVGNSTAARGKDIYASSGTINSNAYNFINYYGEDANEVQAWNAANHVTLGDMDDRNGAEVNVAYTIDSLFTTGTLAVNDWAGQIGVIEPITAETAVEGFKDTYALKTVALKPSEAPSFSNPAQAFIPRTTAISILSYIGSPYATQYVDERNMTRPASGNHVTWDSGAYDTQEGSNGPDDPDDPDVGVVKYIRISGLPNTLRTVGQTTSLFAVGYDIHNNLINRNVSVTWKSSNTGVAYFDTDSSGNIFIRSLGKTTISATTNGGLTDSIELKVDGEMSYTNVHEEVWKRLGNYNVELSAQGMGLAFADEDPASVTSSAFQSAFQKIWSAVPSQVTTLTNASEVNFYSRPAKAGALKPGVNVALSGRTQGEVLPLEYSWTCSYNDLSKLLDRNVTTPPTAAELGKVLRIDFETFSGATVPVVGSSANAKVEATLSSAQVGVSAVDAATTEALSVKESSNGVAIYLKAYLANVQDMNNTGAQLVQRLLVVPDGVADNAISGTMWLSKKAETSSNNNDSNNGNGGGGGGGGGCDAAGLGLAVLLLALPLLARRRR